MDAYPHGTTLNVTVLAYDPLLIYYAGIDFCASMEYCAFVLRLS